MIVLVGKNGQLCNRLFNVSAFLANAIEYKQPLSCYSFDDYYNEFEDINKKCHPLGIHFNTSQRSLARSMINTTAKAAFKFPAFFRRLSIRSYRDLGDLRSHKYLTATKSKRLFVTGWPYWDVDSFIKHAETIRRIFTPRIDYITRGDAFINKLRTEFDVVVGVHIRLGDYKEYLNGSFFFAMSTYELVIDDLYTQLLSEGRRAIFIICSNENITGQLNTTAPLIHSAFSAMEDIVVLSKCDYLFGPPSTFSMWASFYGKVPSINIFSSNDRIRLEDFSPIIAPSTYANGTKLVDIYEKFAK